MCERLARYLVETPIYGCIEVKRVDARGDVTTSGDSAKAEETDPIESKKQAKMIKKALLRSFILKIIVSFN